MVVSVHVWSTYVQTSFKVPWVTGSGEGDRVLTRSPLLGRELPKRTSSSFLTSYSVCKIKELLVGSLRKNRVDRGSRLLWVVCDLRTPGDSCFVSIYWTTRVSGTTCRPFRQSRTVEEGVPRYPPYPFFCFVLFLPHKQVLR